MIFSESFFFGIILLAGIIVALISAVAFTLMICEISENLNEIRINTSKNKDRREFKRNDNSWVCKCGTRNKEEDKYCKSCAQERTLPKPPALAKYITPSVTKTTMHCPECDYVNQSSAQFCKNCGCKLSAVESKNTNDSIFSSWVCPKCGKTNPTSSRVCKECGYLK